MTSPTLAGRVLDWLRAGYPSGVPQQDYVVLLGLLRRKLTDTEVREIAAEIVGLARQGEVTTVADVERLVNAATLDDRPRPTSPASPRTWPPGAGRWPTALLTGPPDRPS